MPLGPLDLATALFQGTIELGQSITTPGVTDAPGLEPWAQYQDEGIPYSELPPAIQALIPSALRDQLESQEKQGLSPRVVLPQSAKAWLTQSKGIKQTGGEGAELPGWVLPVVGGSLAVLTLGGIVTGAILLTRKRRR